jgi:secondary thiamine-phosphate synthase enzyme
MWFQKEISVSACKRGFHSITNEITVKVPEIQEISIGIAHIYIKHTSASLTLNENADPAVMRDMENYISKVVPENEPYYMHTCEGPDDMPAHIKSSLFGTSVTIPITNGQLNLGIWQGIYLCEHRNRAGRRQLIITITGKRMK